MIYNCRYDTKLALNFIADLVPIQNQNKKNAAKIHLIMVLFQTNLMNNISTKASVLEHFFNANKVQFDAQLVGQSGLKLFYRKMHCYELDTWSPKFFLIILFDLFSLEIIREQLKNEKFSYVPASRYFYLP